MEYYYLFVWTISIANVGTIRINARSLHLSFPSWVWSPLKATPAVYPHLVDFTGKLNFRNKSRPTQLRILKLRTHLSTFLQSKSESNRSRTLDLILDLDLHLPDKNLYFEVEGLGLDILEIGQPWIFWKLTFKTRTNTGCPTKHDSSKTTWKSSLILTIIRDIQSSNWLKFIWFLR